MITDEMTKAQREAVRHWSCDNRHRAECREAHGCHCREITAQRDEIERLTKQLQKPRRALEDRT